MRIWPRLGNFTRGFVEFFGRVFRGRFAETRTDVRNQSMSFAEICGEFRKIQESATKTQNIILDYRRGKFPSHDSPESDKNR